MNAIYHQTTNKETMEYPEPMGKCPICDKSTILIKNTSRIGHYKTICKNEYGRHVVDENGVGFYQKFNPARVDPNRFFND